MHMPCSAAIRWTAAARGLCAADTLTGAAVATGGENG